MKRLLFLFRGCRYKYRRSAFKVLCIQKVAEVECLALPGARPGPCRRASCSSYALRLGAYQPRYELRVGTYNRDRLRFRVQMGDSDAIINLKMNSDSDAAAQTIMMAQQITDSPG